MFLHEKFEPCEILDLKLPELREAENMVERLDRYAAMTGQACDADAVSEARLVCESCRVIVGSRQQDLRAFFAFRPPVKISEASSSTLKLAVRAYGYDESLFFLHVTMFFHCVFSDSSDQNLCANLEFVC